MVLVNKEDKMSFVSVASTIPWNKIVKMAPSIIDAATTIWEKVSKTIGLNKRGKEVPSLENLNKRIEQLESNEIQQAELVKNMAGQVGELSTALQVISKRLFLVTILAVTALIGFAILAFKIWIL